MGKLGELFISKTRITYLFHCKVGLHSTQVTNKDSLSYRYWRNSNLVLFQGVIQGLKVPKISSGSKRSRCRWIYGEQHAWILYFYQPPISIKDRLYALFEEPGLSILISTDIIVPFVKFSSKKTSKGPCFLFVSHLSCNGRNRNRELEHVAHLSLCN